MDAGQTAGGLIVSALPGPDLPLPIERALADLAPAGVILFDRNLKTENQIRDLTGAIREVVGRPVLIAVDLEGGRVNRLKHLHPAWAALPRGIQQASWERAKLEDLWESVGQALVALGFDIDFHPPVDLDDSDGTNAIGDRSFGLDPKRTAQTARAILVGLQRAGIIGCLKHYPGLGGTTLDTHVGLASSPLSKDELWERHAAPYRELAEIAPMIMTAHAHYPAVDGPEPLPATYSPRLLQEWLRDRIGYRSVIISDDLEMGAVADGTSAGKRALLALKAGCDLAMFCQELDAPLYARDEIAVRLERGDLAWDEISEKSTRLKLLLASHRGGRGARPPYQSALSSLESLLST
ncbi:MAG: glycoside hydrolase family 3 N-terminal domain-containing protein [Acidobacteriota bacterium]